MSDSIVRDSVARMEGTADGKQAVNMAIGVTGLGIAFVVATARLGSSAPPAALAHLD